MRSHLTRRVFRRLILNQPVVRHRPLHVASRPRPLGYNVRNPHKTPIQVRTFFGFFEKKQGRDLREPLLDPGMEKMLELEKRLNLVARLPAASELVKAFNAFVQSRLTKLRGIEDFHAAQLLQTLKIIENPDSVEQGNAQVTSGDDAKLSKKDLHALFEALKNTPASVYTREHNALAKLAWQALCAREAVESPSKDPSRTRRPFGYLQVLCGTGGTDFARQEALKTEDSDGRHGAGIPGLGIYWLPIVAGYAFERNEKAMLEVVQYLKDEGVDINRPMERTIASFYAQKDDVDNAKKWFHSRLFEKGVKDSRRLQDMCPSRDQALQTLLQFCLRNNELHWGQELLAVASKNAKETEIMTWNAVFLASAATGKSVDQIDRMISVMARRAPESKTQQPVFGVHIFNGLIKFANSKNDPYTAERYFGLLQKYNVQPDTTTYILQIEYRLLAEDFDGAMASYDALRRQTISEDEDWPVMNQLVRALVARPSTPNDVIMGLVEDLSERKRVFPADTVLSLCMYHLERDEYFYIVDLLQTYAYQYSIAQRLKIRDVLIQYTLDTRTDIGRAWDTYMIFHQVFDQETRRDIRNKVMTTFFDRRRPDLGTHVFTRMSKHMRADTRPDADTYVRAFEGISRTAEPDALEIIHNLLKLDTEVDMSTKLLNSLMLAYTACGMPQRALDFWEQIAISSEGPSYQSLHIAFRACERAPFGYDEAIKIFTKLRQADIEITKELFADYMGCLSGQGMVDLVMEGMRTMEKYTGQPLDFHTLASVMNACPGVVLQRRIEDECLKAFPQLWAQILERGLYENAMGIKLVKDVSRSLKA